MWSLRGRSREPTLAWLDGGGVAVAWITQTTSSQKWMTWGREPRGVLSVGLTTQPSPCYRDGSSLGLAKRSGNTCVKKKRKKGGWGYAFKGARTVRRERSGVLRNFLIYIYMKKVVGQALHRLSFAAYPFFFSLCYLPSFFFLYNYILYIYI